MKCFNTLRSFFNRYRGHFAILGGVLVHITLGTVYTFGNLTPYLTSYIRAYGSPSDLRYVTSVWIFVASFMGYSVSTFLGGIIHRMFGPRWTTLFGSMLMSIGVFLTYLTVQSFVGVVFTYGLICGIGVGIAYTIPMASAMKWFPQSKGLANGCVVAGFGTGSLIFDLVQTAYINPENKATNAHVEGDEYFTQPEILDNVPNIFWILGLCYVSIQIIGSLLVIDPPLNHVREMTSEHRDGGTSVDICRETEFVMPTDRPEQEEATIVQVRVPEEHAVLTPRQMICDQSFWKLYFVFVCNGIGWLFFTSLYKDYGQSFIKDDKFLAWVGGIAALFNAGGRIAWGYFADKFSFKLGMICMCVMFLILVLTFGLTSLVGKPLFFIYVCLITTFSGNYSLFPVAISKSFGQLHYPINFGVLFTGWIVSGPTAVLITSNVKHHVDWYGMFFIIAGLTTVSIITMFFFKLKTFEGKEI